MQDAVESSRLTRLFSVTFFLVLVVASFTWFVVSAISLMSQFADGSPVVFFDKGAVYMLGVGIGLAALLLAGIGQGLLRLTLSAKVESNLKRVIVAAIVLMFILPQLVHYSVNKYIAKIDYHICQEVSYQWLLYKKIVYAESKDICSNLLREQNLTKGATRR